MRSAGGYQTGKASSRQAKADVRWSSDLRGDENAYDQTAVGSGLQQRPPWRSTTEVKRGPGANRNRAGTLGPRTAAWKPIPLMEVEPEPPPLRRHKPTGYARKNYDSRGRLKAQMGTGMKQLREQLEQVTKEHRARVAQQQEAYDANVVLARRLGQARRNVEANTMS